LIECSAFFYRDNRKVCGSPRIHADRTRERGRVRLKKYVVTDYVEKKVPVKQEAVRLEREPHDEGTAADRLPFVYGRSHLGSAARTARRRSPARRCSR
jgi:hypothetical protein